MTYVADFLKDGKRVARHYVTASNPVMAERIAERIVTVAYDELEVNPL